MLYEEVGSIKDRRWTMSKFKVWLSRGAKRMLERGPKDKIGYEYSAGTIWGSGHRLYKGVKVEVDSQENIHLELESTIQRIPSELLAFVTRIKFEDLWPLEPRRVCGSYVLRTASGSIKPIILNPREGPVAYGLQVDATVFEDAVELYSGILSREINPNKVWE